VDTAKLALLTQHYEATFTLIKDELRRRDRYSFAVLLLVVVMLFQLYSPTDAEKAIARVVGEKLGFGTSLDVSFLGTVIWFSLLIVVMKYYQVLAEIERLYTYIHKLEAQLTPEFGGGIYSREGIDYLSSFNRFRAVTHFLYTKAFPTLLLLATFTKIYAEYGAGQISPLLVLNILLYLALLVISAIYIYSRFVDTTESETA